MTDPIRLGGLISGTDVQGIIDQLLTLRTKRIDVVQEQKVDLQEDMLAWTDINSSTSTLSDALYKLRSLSTWRAMDAASSNELVMTATARSSAAESVYTISINQRAAAHSVASDQFDASTDLVGDGVLTAGDTFTIGAPAGDPRTVTIGATETLATLAAKINDASASLGEDEQVFAQIIDSRLVITRSKTGSDVIQLNDTLNTPLADLGIGTTGSYSNVWVDAQDAEFTVNGSDVITRSSNTGITDVISGVTLNLVAGSGSATLTVAPDISSTKETILEVVEAYNQVVGKVLGYTEVNVTDPRNPDVGQLQGDTMARGIPIRFRQLATARKSSMTGENASYTYDGRTGVLNNLQGIGIWTGGKGSGALGTDNALDIVDEDRLDYMLANHYDLVEQLFMGVAGADEKGIARDLYEYADQLSSSLIGDIDQKIVRVSNQVAAKDQQIDKMFDELDRYEKRLWHEFTIMEDAVARMQQDLSWLVSQTGVDSK